MKTNIDFIESIFSFQNEKYSANISFLYENEEICA